jgi:hypothetical protein
MAFVVVESAISQPELNLHQNKTNGFEEWEEETGQLWPTYLPLLLSLYVPYTIYWDPRSDLDLPHLIPQPNLTTDLISRSTSKYILT